MLLNSAVGRHEITCSGVEYVTIIPPGGQSCQQYLGQYINQSGGYITNPNALENCQYCSYRTTDQFLQTNSNIFYSHHWRNFGFMWIYVGFNVRRHLIISFLIPHL
jgi:ATP-binding cassette subfamily G (WHITE) protein 2 (SNQ2)